jgi:zinc/manganese transport system permease protein
MSFMEVEWSILIPAFIAGILVLTTHVPLGQEVLKRGIIFIDLAIAQIAGLGLIAAHTFGFELAGWQIQLIALASALTGAVFLGWLERHFHDALEAFIGVIFILSATGGLLLLAGNPQAGEHLKDILTGQILWVDNQQLILLAIVSAVVLGLRFAFRNSKNNTVFYLIFAIAVTASVQLVGVYLVFSSLIIPALATRRITLIRKRTIIGLLVGAGGYLFGLLLSVIWDLPSGSIIVWTLAVLGLLVNFYYRKLPKKDY